MEEFLKPFEADKTRKRTNPERGVFEGMGRVLQTLGAEIYFASGAFEGS